MIKKIWAGVIFTLVCVPVLVSAAEMRAGDQPSLAANEKISDDFYIAGGNVSSAGAITGDLIAAGGNILINSAVTQDILAGGGSITILGTIGDDVRVGGGNITVSGAVKGDVVVAGGQTQISGVGVGGDVVWAGGTIRIEAPVGGDLKLGGGEVYINAPIKGNVEFKGDKLTLGPAATIQGNLTYTSPKEAVLESGAVVSGETKYEPSKSMHEGTKGAAATFFSLALFTKFLMTLACALVVGLIFTKYANAMVEGAVEKPLLELGRGFIILIVTPIASIVLLITVLGIPLGILGLLGFVAICIFASIAGPILLGSVAYKLAMKPHEYQVTWLTILIGAVLYSILGWIPIIGWLAKFIIFLIALGVTMKLKWDIAKNWR